MSASAVAQILQATTQLKGDIVMRSQGNESNSPCQTERSDIFKTLPELLQIGMDSFG
jgi:hypothetical protein